jgi:hypothetical protein
MVVYPIETKKLVIPDGLGNTLSDNEIYDMAYNIGYADGYEVGAEECANKE